MSARFPRSLWALALAAVVCAAAAVRADEADDRYAVGAAHYAAARWNLAVEEFQAFLQAYPSHPKAAQANFFLAEALIQLKRFAEAASCYRSYLDREPQGRLAPESLFRWGEAEYLAGQGVQAKKPLTDFMAKYPGHALAAYALPYLGDLALREGDAPGAATHPGAISQRPPPG